MFRQYLQRMHQTLIQGRRMARFPKAARTTSRPLGRLRVEGLEARELLTAYSLAFNVNAALSVLNESGNVTGAYSQDIKEQDSGSLSTHYSGTLNALYDPSAQTFQFLAAGWSLTAANSGSWQPLAGGGTGYAPANYGNYAGYANFFAFETGFFSFRGLTGNLSHPSPVSVAGGILPSGENVHLTGNDDYAFHGNDYTQYGTSFLSTTPTNNPLLLGQFQDLGGGSFHVTVPIDISFTQALGPGEVAHFHLSGSVQADASYCTAQVAGGVLTATNTGPAATRTLGHAGSTTTICGASFAANSYSSVVINTGNAHDTVNIEYTLTGKPVTVNDGSGSDDVRISPSAENLNNIQGTVTVHGNHAGVDNLIVNDQNNGASQTFTLGIDSIARTGVAIYYDNLANYVTVNGGNGGNTFNVQALAGSYPSVTLNAGAFNNVINVGSAAGSLDSIQAPLTVNGAGGINTLNINDPSSGGGQTYTMTSTTVGRSPAATVTYNAIQALTVNSSAGSNNVVNVQSTSSPTKIVGHTSFTVNVGNAGKTEGIVGDLTITDPPTNALATVNVDDSADGSFRTATLDTITITGLGYGRIHGLSQGDILYRYVDTNAATVQTGTGGATVNVKATGKPVTLIGHNDVTVNVSNAGSVQAIAGPLTISDPPAFITLNVDDSQDGIFQTATLDTVTIGGARYGRIGGLSADIRYKYADTKSVTLETGMSGARVNALATSTPVNLIGNPGGGIVSLYASDADNTWNITSQNAGTLSSSVIAGTVMFTGVPDLHGGNGADTFVFADGAGVDIGIDGGGGTNTLDYSAYSTTVLVDLQTGSATGVGAGIANIQNVAGGTGGGAGIYNILVGNGGNVLTGGDGRRNLLIAGASASTLLGGNDDDILIGGTTAYDTEAGLASLQAIMNYWSTTADDYGTRVGNLLSGNGVPLLDATMVHNNGGGNTLTGNHGGPSELDLFYGLDPALETTDYNPALGEQFINC
jgi:hypothetical protein